MSDYKDENGEWRHGTSGERLNVHDYQGGPANYNSGGGSGVSIFGGDKVMQGIGGILKLIPYFIAIGVFILFDLLETSKRKKGRLGQSIAFGILTGILFIMAFKSAFFLLPVDNASFFGDLSAYAVMILSAFWYYKFHYGAVRCMRQSLTLLLINPFTIMIFGSVVLFIISLVAGIMGTIDHRANYDFVIFGVPVIIGVIVYLISAKPFIEQAKDLQRRNMPFPDWESRDWESKKDRKKREKQEKAREQEIAEYEKRKQEEDDDKKNQKDAKKAHPERFKDYSKKHRKEEWAIVEKGEKFMEANNFEEAIKYFTEILPNCTCYYYNALRDRSESYFKIGMYDKALEDINECIYAYNTGISNDLKEKILKAKRDKGEI